MALVKELFEARKAAGRAMPTTPYIAIATRVQEALDAGRTPEEIRLVLPRLPTYGQGAFDLGFAQLERSRGADRQQRRAALAEAIDRGASVFDVDGDGAW